MIKNAIAYITRKKNRTLIIFAILTIVLSCLYSCLTIMKSSNEIEKALYESSNSSISITKKDGKYFNINQFKNIEKIKEV
ncbi:TPA: ABC transporter permease, partial [Streptococcus agalactiae]|nr:ABC transporter permease [Streptococcus agalactiae]